MRLEKINDNQIRITLTGEDLERRQIRLSELAYGSDKAQSLFRDMMAQAQKKLGWNADNIPLMIEAIPVGKDSITLLITKVEDPEELDTRFARFSPSAGNGGPKVRIGDADDILNLIRRLYDAKQKASSPAENEAQKKPAKTEKPARKSVSQPAGRIEFARLYRFRTLDLLIDAAKVLGASYDSENTLYKTGGARPYSLILKKGAHTPEEFNKICNVLSEYGESLSCTASREASLREHGRLLMKDRALQDLAGL